MRHAADPPAFFGRFLAAFLIAGQLAWGLPAVRADTLRPMTEGKVQAGLEEELRGVRATFNAGLKEDLRYETAGLADLDEILSVRDCTFGPNPAGNRPFKDDLAGIIGKRQPEAVWVARDRGRIIGYSVAKNAAWDAARLAGEIYELAVLPAYQGRGRIEKGRGAGTQLFARALNGLIEGRRFLRVFVRDGSNRRFTGRIARGHFGFRRVQNSRLYRLDLPHEEVEHRLADILRPTPAGLEEGLALEEYASPEAAVMVLPAAAAEPEKPVQVAAFFLRKRQWNIPDLTQPRWSLAEETRMRDRLWKEGLLVREALDRLKAPWVNPSQLSPQPAYTAGGFWKDASIRVHGTLQRLVHTRPNWEPRLHDGSLDGGSAVAFSLEDGRRVFIHSSRASPEEIRQIHSLLPGAEILSAAGGWFIYRATYRPDGKRIRKRWNIRIPSDHIDGVLNAIPWQADRDRKPILLVDPVYAAMYRHTRRGFSGHKIAPWSQLVEEGLVKVVEADPKERCLNPANFIVLPNGHILMNKAPKTAERLIQAGMRLEFLHLLEEPVVELAQLGAGIGCWAGIADKSQVPAAGLEESEKGLFLTRVRPEDRSAAPFSSEEEIEQALLHLQEIRPQAENQPIVSGSTIQLLYRLSRTVPPGNKSLNTRIQKELLFWVSQAADARVTAAVLAGWATPAYSSAEAVLQNRVLRSSPQQTLFPVLESRGLARERSAELMRLSRQPTYQPLRVRAEGEPLPYQEQLRARIVYGKLGKDKAALYVSRLEAIRVAVLKRWLEEQFQRTQSVSGRVVSIAAYGSFPYGFRTEPADIDLLAVVDAPLNAAVKQTLDIPPELFGSDYARRVRQADVTFITREQLERSPRVALQMASVAAVLRGEGLSGLQFEGDLLAGQIVWAGQLIHEGRRKAAQPTQATDRYEDASATWKGKAMRRAFEGNLLIAKVDPSTAVPQSVMEGFEDRVRRLLEGPPDPDALKRELQKLYEMLETALLQARAALVWREIERTLPTDPSRWAPELEPILKGLERLEQDEIDRPTEAFSPGKIADAVEALRDGNPGRAAGILVRCLEWSAPAPGPMRSKQDQAERLTRLVRLLLSIEALPKGLPPQADRHAFLRQKAERSDVAQAVFRRLAYTIQAYATAPQRKELPPGVQQMFETLRDSPEWRSVLPLLHLYRFIERIRLGEVTPERYLSQAWFPFALIEATVLAQPEKDLWRSALAYWGVGALLDALGPAAAAELLESPHVKPHLQPGASDLPGYYFDLARKTMAQAAGLEEWKETIRQLSGIAFSIYWETEEGADLKQVLEKHRRELKAIHISPAGFLQAVVGKKGSLQELAERYREDLHAQGRSMILPFVVIAILRAWQQTPNPALDAMMVLFYADPLEGFPSDLRSTIGPAVEEFISILDRGEMEEFFSRILRLVRAPASGLEEKGSKPGTLLEWLKGSAAAELRTVVVIGRSAADRFPALRALAELEERFLVDEGDDTVVRLVERGVRSVAYYGGPEESLAFAALAGEALISVEARSPGAPEFLAQLREILSLAGIHQDVLSVGLEEFADEMDSLAVGA